MTDGRQREGAARLQWRLGTKGLSGGVTRRCAAFAQTDLIKPLRPEPDPASQAEAQEPWELFAKFSSLQLSEKLFFLVRDVTAPSMGAVLLLYCLPLPTA